MVKFLLVVAAGLLVSSCAAGGAAVSTGEARWQGYWWDIGIDRYQPVIYPSRPVGP